jgi:S-DNA-T family DNA segregation ATPase FtsK/SpoIIIE
LTYGERSVDEHRRRRPVGNWMGSAGAWGVRPAAEPRRAADRPSSFPSVFVLGLRLLRGVEPRAAGAGPHPSPLLGIALVGTAAALFAGGAVNGLPAGWGGGVGLALARP